MHLPQIELAVAICLSHPHHINGMEDEHIVRFFCVGQQPRCFYPFQLSAFNLFYLIAMHEGKIEKYKA